jgi:hypothetical protein
VPQDYVSHNLTGPRAKSPSIDFARSLTFEKQQALVFALYFLFNLLLQPLDEQLKGRKCPFQLSFIGTTVFSKQKSEQHFEGSNVCTCRP